MQEVDVDHISQIVILKGLKRRDFLFLKEINPEYSLEGLMLKLKLQYLATWCEEQLIRKDPDAGEDWRQEEKGMTEDEMVGWHHWLNGHEFQRVMGDGEGQEDLTRCSLRGLKESDMTERLNNKYKEKGPGNVLVRWWRCCYWWWW